MELLYVIVIAILILIIYALLPRHKFILLTKEGCAACDTYRNTTWQELRNRYGGVFSGYTFKEVEISTNKKLWEDVKFHWGGNLPQLVLVTKDGRRKEFPGDDPYSKINEWMN